MIIDKAMIMQSPSEMFAEHVVQDGTAPALLE